MMKTQNHTTLPQPQQQAKRLLHSLAVIILAIGVSLVAACEKDDKTEAIETAAMQFGTAYFNLDFQQAAQLSTPSSRRWIEFHASNITQDDIDVYNQNEQNAECETDKVKQLNDTTATASLTVRNFLAADTIGSTGTIKPEAHFNLTLKVHEGQWLVELDRPLLEN